MTMNAWTDYTIYELGDKVGKKAPVRQVEVLSYDGDKRCMVEIMGHRAEIKSGYLYQAPGRIGEVPGLTRRMLAMLPRSSPNFIVDSNVYDIWALWPDDYMCEKSEIELALSWKSDDFELVNVTAYYDDGAPAQWERVRK